jgi:hypothetical protein
MCPVCFSETMIEAEWRENQLVGTMTVCDACHLYRQAEMRGRITVSVGDVTLHSRHTDTEEMAVKYRSDYHNALNKARGMYHAQTSNA